MFEKHFLLRIPKQLFLELKNISIQEKRSLNAQILFILEAYVKSTQNKTESNS